MHSFMFLCHAVLSILVSPVMQSPVSSLLKQPLSDNIGNSDSLTAETLNSVIIGSVDINRGMRQNKAVSSINRTPRISVAENILKNLAMNNKPISLAFGGEIPYDEDDYVDPLDSTEAETETPLFHFAFIGNNYNNDYNHDDDSDESYSIPYPHWQDTINSFYHRIASIPSPVQTYEHLNFPFRQSIKKRPYPYLKDPVNADKNTAVNIKLPLKIVGEDQSRPPAWDSPANTVNIIDLDDGENNATNSENLPNEHHTQNETLVTPSSVAAASQVVTTEKINVFSQEMEDNNKTEIQETVTISIKNQNDEMTQSVIITSNAIKTEDDDKLEELPGTTSTSASIETLKPQDVILPTKIELENDKIKIEENKEHDLLSEFTTMDIEKLEIGTTPVSVSELLPSPTIADVDKIADEKMQSSSAISVATETKAENETRLEESLEFIDLILPDKIEFEEDKFIQVGENEDAKPPNKLNSNGSTSENDSSIVFSTISTTESEEPLDLIISTIIEFEKDKFISVGGDDQILSTTEANKLDQKHPLSKTSSVDKPIDPIKINDEKPINFENHDKMPSTLSSTVVTEKFENIVSTSSTTEFPDLFIPVQIIYGEGKLISVDDEKLTFPKMTPNGD